MRLSSRIARVVAPNASPMTGPGPNTYLLGAAQSAVLDPGPDDAGHLEVLISAAPRLRYVFVTHTHRDHSPLARILAARTGAVLVATPAPGDGRQDLSCVPDVIASDAARFELGGEPATTLQVIATPGHASNHVCYLLTQERVLFSGDHLLEGVTPVILAPDGDMAAYLDSLRRLAKMPIGRIAPGHGRVFERHPNAIELVIAHRERRERKVLDALHALGAGTLDELLPRVYDDVSPSMHIWARLSLEAHLVKLAAERRARCELERWLAL
jgi:glyoxylase-like metal-dependent hydrolase (beta-lactamase superfamily II)